ncbi:MAG TPA: alkaline phosphatase family protein [Gaiellaceae bacterium]|nr:alkaline phosphatase family protein [Gaiellaceae bacterium]
MRRALALLALSAGALVLAGSTSAAQPRDGVKNFQHVFVIMMENTGYNHLVGNADAPWINSAIAKYGVATQYFGASHPSQPNYIAATSGITGPNSDNDETLAVPNIVDNLEAAGKSWTAYMQSYSLCVTPFDHACGNQLYERKHNPFISYADVQSSPQRISHIVDYSQLSSDLASNTVSDYNWISPDQCNDMHGRGGGGSSDPCDFSNEPLLIRAGDTFLKNTVDAIQDSRAWNGNSAIFIVWDESDFGGTGPSGFPDTSGCCDASVPFGGGHVLGLVISHSDHQPRQSSVAYNHYSLLRTIEDGWKLGCLGATCDTANVPAMTDLVGPKG